MNERLAGLRAEIDDLNEAIVRALARRMAVCRRVAEVKLSGDIPVMQPERIRAVRDRMVAMGNRYGLSESYIDDILALMIAETCRVEDGVIADVRTASAPAPIFVGGEDRSGTTLVSLILDSHPQLTFGPELSFAEPVNLGPHIIECCTLLLDDDVRTRGPGVAAASQALAAGVQFARQARRHGIDHATLLRLVAETMRWAGSDLVEYEDRLRLIEAIGRERRRTTGRRGWGMKIQREITRCASFLDVWPAARFVHVVRDGRDVAASHLLGRRGWGPQTITAAATQWQNLVRQVPRCVPDHHLFELRYEDLIADTEAALRRLLAFLDLDWDDGVLCHVDRQHSLLIEPLDHPSADAAARPVYAHAVGRFRRDLTPVDVAAYEDIAQDALRRHGYVGSVE